MIFFNHNSKDALEQYVKAIRMTIKDYAPEVLPTRHLLTKTELMIINNISRTYYFLGEEENAIKIMEFLKSYFEQDLVIEDEKARNYDVILFNLENWYGKLGNHEKVVELAELGRNACIQFGKLNLFPYHVFNKGYALAECGKMSEAKESLTSAFEIMKSMRQPDEVNFGVKDVNEKFGFDFPMV